MGGGVNKVLFSYGTNEPKTDIGKHVCGIIIRLWNNLKSWGTVPSMMCIRTVLLSCTKSSVAAIVDCHTRSSARWWSILQSQLLSQYYSMIQIQSIAGCFLWTSWRNSSSEITSQVMLCWKTLSLRVLVGLGSRNALWKPQCSPTHKIVLQCNTW